MLIRNKKNLILTLQINSLKKIPFIVSNHMKVETSKNGRPKS